MKYKGFSITKNEDGYIVTDIHTNRLIASELESENEAIYEVDVYLDDMHNFNDGPWG